MKLFKYFAWQTKYIFQQREKYIMVNCIKCRRHIQKYKSGRLRSLTGSALDHRSLSRKFESRGGHIWRMLHRFITSSSLSAHLAYHVHKSGRNNQTSIIRRTCKTGLPWSIDIISFVSFRIRFFSCRAHFICRLLWFIKVTKYLLRRRVIALSKSLDKIFDLKYICNCLKY